ncbi:glycosyltransferase [Candidatus Uhrbacteria bacterium]|nr:glycosyltransferase [Candidatus Uhrbacteria bacterium]
MTPATILCAGGGTAGSIVPLKFLLEKRRERIQGGAMDRVIWITTGSALDARYVGSGVQHRHTIPIAKWRRYLAFTNLAVPLNFLVALVKSLFYCVRYRPHAVWTAGSFVGVPVAWAAWLLGIPVMSIQQDIVRGVANRLIEPVSSRRVLTIPPRLLAKAPLRRSYTAIGTLIDPSASYPLVEESVCDVLILGGSIGARGLNELVWGALPLLSDNLRVIHSVGAQHHVEPPKQRPGYTAVGSIEPSRLARLLNRARLVVTRAGMNTIIQCAYYSKATIVVPLPESHQILNARALEEEKAVVYLQQDSTTPQDLADAILELLQHPHTAERMSQRLHALLPVAKAQDILNLIKV